MQVTLSSRTNLSQITTINQAFGWMFVGLIVTAVAAFFISSSPTLTNAIINNGFVYIGLSIAELAIVFVLSARIQSMTYEEAVGTFLLYSFLNGLTLSAVFLGFTGTSIVSTALVTALVFGTMAVYGYTTQRDLTTIGSLAFMALIGIIIASIVNLFLNSTPLSYLLSYLSILIFIGLTAYDTQKIKQMESYSDNQNLGILGAITLYLDFFNIFLDLLRILGKRRED